VIAGPATAADAALLAALDARCNPAAWSEQAFAAHLAAAPPNATLVLRDGSGLAAFCAFRVVFGELEILQLGTDPDRRRRGLARDLMGQVLAAGRAAGAGAAWLEVRVGNAAARALYAGLGFAEVGRRAAYYTRPPEDALVLRRAIGPP
jgi:ribosomal-protein-alanine N-acetyltransferase